ncbi:MAG TPA: PilZ domain-containing protein [Desulfobulbaceae bacterium]|nr:PilZ domain-containing protein [Desulfobulbaceae bacterium]
MITELRRSKRITDYLPILVSAKKGDTGALLAGPFSGRIIDISEYGACLLMSQVMKDTYHVFHSTREDDTRILQLTINVPPDNIPFSITAHPIWLDLFRQDQIRAFKMGIEFIASPEGELMKQLQKAMKIQQRKRGNWWTSHMLTGSA